MTPANTDAQSRKLISRILPVSLIILMSSAAAMTTNGCIQRLWERDDNAAFNLESAPPIMLEQGEDKHLIVMQAPSPGWSVRLDKTERTPDGKRVYITIRRPDPAFQYTQQLVQMRLLTTVRLDNDIEVVGRLLNHDEKTKNRGYAPVPLVESFE
ncbi:MAG: hypothetical protein AB8C13_05840 [Phycisphaerales bacterium]